MKNILPLGSIVVLKNVSKKIMINARIQQSVSKGTVYDYSGCLYPEGNKKPSENLLFNHEDIQTLVFLGYQDADEEKFNKEVIQKYYAQAEKIKNSI